MNKDEAAWVLLGAAAAVAVVILPIAVEPVRLLYAVAFCLLVPGCGWAYRAAVGDTVDKIALTVVISLSATILVSTAMVVTNSWSVPGGVAVLTVFAALGFVPITRASPGRGLSPDRRRGPR